MKQPLFRRCGFTLIELLIVMAIVATLLSLVSPKYFQHVERSKEAVLRQNLLHVRDAIDKYYADRGRFPDSLEDLVEHKYIRNLPIDPITESDATWILSPPEESDTQGSVGDIHSGAQGETIDGTPYSDL